MKLLKMLIAGLIGGAIGAAIWAGIAMATHYEIGWIAWGIGFLVGLAVRLAAGDETQGFVPGVLAAAIAVAAIAGGKFATVHFLIEREAASALGNAISDNDATVSIADEVVAEYTEKGQAINWPPGQNALTADESGDYPPDIWAEATKRYQAIPAAEREEQKKSIAQARAAFIGVMKSEIRSQAFAESFSAIDILFFLLAIVTAFKLGSGLASSA